MLRRSGRVSSVLGGGRCRSCELHVMSVFLGRYCKKFCSYLNTKRATHDLKKKKAFRMDATGMDRSLRGVWKNFISFMDEEGNFT